MDDEKIILNAALDGIIRGSDVDENVRDCVEILRVYATAADQTLMHMRHRGATEHLTGLVDYFDLPRVGRYASKRKKKKKSQVISFRKDDRAVDFFFKRRNENTADRARELLDMARRSDLNGVEMMVATLGAVKGTSPNETLTGGRARALGCYDIDHVEVVQYSPAKFLSWDLPWSMPERETVYRG